MNTEHAFAREEVLPSWWANGVGYFLSRGAFGLSLSKQDATHIQVVAGPGDRAAIVAVDGRWRWVEATINRAHPGGAAGAYDIYVTTTETDISSSPAPYTDDTNYAFALAIVAAGATPAIVAGTVDAYTKVGQLQWDGAQITRIDQTLPAPLNHAHTHAVGGPDPLSPADIGAATAADLTADLASLTAEITAETSRAEAAEANLVAKGSTATLANLTLTGTLTVDGAATLDGSLSVVGAATSQGDITARSGAATQTSIGSVGGAPGVSFDAGAATLTYAGGWMTASSNLATQDLLAVNATGGNQAFFKSSGAGYGVVMNPSGTTWALGYSANLAPGLGTAALTWDTAGDVTVHGTLTAQATLSVAGLATLSGGAQVTGNASATGNLIQSSGATTVTIGPVGPAGQSGVALQNGEAGSNLYRSTTGTLRTDGALVVASSLTVLGSTFVGTVAASGGYTQSGSGANTFTGSLAVTGAGGVSVSSTLAVTGASTLTGLVTGRAGLTLDAGSGTAGQTLTLVGRNAGAAANVTLAVSAAGGAAWTIPAGQTYQWSIGAGVIGTLSSSQFDIASGGKYTIGGTQITASNLLNGVTGTAGTPVVLQASPSITGTLGAQAISASGAVSVGGNLSVTGGSSLSVAGSSTLAGVSATTVAATGLISGRAGLLLDAVSGTAGQTLSLVGRNAGAGATATITVSTVGTLTRNVPAGQSHVWQVNGTTVSSTGSDGSGSYLNVSAGGQFRIGMTQISASDLSNTTTGTSGFPVVLANAPAIAGGGTWSGGPTIFGPTLSSPTVTGPLTTASVVTTPAASAVGITVNSNSAGSIVVNQGDDFNAIRVVVGSSVAVGQWTHAMFEAERPVNGSESGGNPAFFRGKAGSPLGSNFYVDIAGNVYATFYTNPSDRALKENVRPLAGALSTVLALRPRSGRWSKHEHNERRGMVGEEFHGFVAQEVEQVIPHAVADFHVTDDETLRALRPTELIPFLVGAVHELEARLRAVEGKR